MLLGDAVLSARASAGCSSVRTASRERGLPRGCLAPGPRSFGDPPRGLGPSPRPASYRFLRHAHPLSPPSLGGPFLRPRGASCFCRTPVPLAFSPLAGPSPSQALTRPPSVPLLPWRPLFRRSWSPQACTHQATALLGGGRGESTRFGAVRATLVSQAVVGEYRFPLREVHPDAAGSTCCPRPLGAPFPRRAAGERGSDGWALTDRNSRAQKDLFPDSNQGPLISSLEL